MKEQKNNPVENSDELMSNNTASNDHFEEIDTSAIDEQWAELTQDWQDQPVAHTDIKVLLKQTRRRTIKAKLLFGANILSTLGFVIGWLYGQFWANWDRGSVNFWGIASVVCIIFCYLEYKVRKKAWSNISDAPDQAINNAIEGARSSLNYIKLTKWSFIPSSIIANYHIWDIATQAEKSPIKALLVLNVLVLVMYIIAHLFGVKRQKELNSLLEKTKS